MPRLPRSSTFASALPTTVVLALLAVLPTSVLAAPEKLRGVIKAVDWSAMQMAIALKDERVVTFRVKPDATVRFSEGAEFFPHPKLQDLQPKMYIFFVHEDRLIDDIEVREIPPELRHPRSEPRPQAANPSSAERTVKARIQSIDERRGEFRADVAGRTDIFRAENPRMLRRYAEGDLVIFTVTSRGGEELVTEMRPAALTGRVTRVDQRRREIAVEVDGRVETYGVEEKRLLDGLRIGDRIRFEFEDRRSGRNVITAIY